MMKQKRVGLVAARKRKGWTQQHMANLLCVTLRTYQSYEYCESGLPFSTAEEIAKILEISLDELSLRKSSTNGGETESA